MTADPQHDALRALIGEPSRRRRVGADPVSAAQVRLWRDAMGDAAAGPAADDVPAVPRAMLAAFSGGRLAHARAAADDIATLTDVLGGRGLLPAGTGITQTYLADIRVGDTITEVAELERVSPRKLTRLGPGYFLTLLTRFADQAGTSVGEQRITLLAYEQGGRGSAAVAAPPPPPAADEPGERLPPLAVTLDRLGIILCSAACGDYAAGHYDPDVARARGFEDIFTDVYTGVGLVHRYVTGRAGARARVRSIDLRLGAPFYAGDTLRLSGRIVRRDGPGATIGVQGHCRTGMHLDGTVELVRTGDDQPASPDRRGREPCTTC